MAYEFESELELEGELEDEGEEELEGEDFLGDFLGEGEDFLGDLIGESEGEDEGEEEYEEGMSPIRKVYPDAVMEHLGELAAESESEDEAAEHFLPLVGMAASKLLPVVAKAVAPAARKALPKIAKALSKATPRLTRGIGKVAKVLHRNPNTRHLLRVVPGIARRTVGTIAHRAARGGRITPGTAVRTLVRQTRRVLGSPAHRAKALRRHHHLERKLHGRMGPGITRQHGRYGSRPGWRYGRRVRVPGRTVPGYARGASGVYRTGVTAPAVGGRPARYGSAVGRPRACPPCPTCGTSAVARTPLATSAPTPAYCRCCGQVLR
jgi:hypothetical protein